MIRPADDEEHVHVRLGLYVLGALPQDECFLVEAHLARCFECWTSCAELGEVRVVLDQLSPQDLTALADEFSPEPSCDFLGDATGTSANPPPGNRAVLPPGGRVVLPPCIRPVRPTGRRRARPTGA